MAYLQAIPDDPNWPKDMPKKSRMQIRLDQGIKIEMPPIDLPYMIEWLNELGCVASGMNGVIPIDNREIESWINLNGVEITHWEARMLRELSKTYCAQYNRSKDLECEEPFATEVDLVSVRDTAEQKIRNIF